MDLSGLADCDRVWVCDYCGNELHAGGDWDDRVQPCCGEVHNHEECIHCRQSTMEACEGHMTTLGMDS